MNHSQKSIFPQAKQAVGEFALPWDYCNCAPMLLTGAAVPLLWARLFEFSLGTNGRLQSSGTRASTRLSIWAYLTDRPYIKQSVWCKPWWLWDAHRCHPKGNQGKRRRERWWLLFPHPLPLTGNTSGRTMVRDIKTPSSRHIIRAGLLLVSPVLTCCIF